MKTLEDTPTVFSTERVHHLRDIRGEGQRCSQSPTGEITRINK
jgi:hypothetical protein